MLLSAGLTCHSWRQADALPVSRKVSIYIEGLPEDLDGFRIVQLSDLHVDLYTPRGWLERVVGIANSMAPDMIAITGDLADASVDQVSATIRLLSELSASHGCFFVTGNHEYGTAAQGVAPWLSHLEALGIHVLLNEHRLISHGNGTVLVGGVTDHDAEFSLPAHASKPSAVLKHAPATDVRMLLAHQPKSIYRASELGFDLQLSGHTHGGQIFPGHLLMAATQPFVSGLHRHGDTQIYVSSGTGSWGPKMRLGTTAEISVLVLATVPPSHEASG